MMVEMMVIVMVIVIEYSSAVRSPGHQLPIVSHRTIKSFCRETLGVDDTSDLSIRTKCRQRRR